MLIVSCVALFSLSATFVFCCGDWASSETTPLWVDTFVRGNKQPEWWDTWTLVLWKDGLEAVPSRRVPGNMLIIWLNLICYQEIRCDFFQKKKPTASWIKKTRLAIMRVCSACEKWIKSQFKLPFNHKNMLLLSKNTSVVYIKVFYKINFPIRQHKIKYA